MARQTYLLPYFDRTSVDVRRKYSSFSRIRFWPDKNVSISTDLSRSWPSGALTCTKSKLAKLKLRYGGALTNIVCSLIFLIEIKYPASSIWLNSRRRNHGRWNRERKSWKRGRKWRKPYWPRNPQALIIGRGRFCRGIIRRNKILANPPRPEIWSPLTPRVIQQNPIVGREWMIKKDDVHLLRIYTTLWRYPQVRSTVMARLLTTEIYIQLCCSLHDTLM